jgi:hypothetical protein
VTLTELATVAAIALASIGGYLGAQWIKRYPNLYRASMILCGGVILIVTIRACKEG